MTRIRTLAYAMGLFFWGVDDGFAGEAMTECPPTKPGHPEIGFKYGEPWPEGVPLGGGASKYEEKNGLVYSTYDYDPIRPLLNSVIVCQYMDGTKIHLPVPGELLRCGTVIRDISRTPPIKKEWLRVWCVSQVP